MGRKRINDAVLTARVQAGTPQRIDKVLKKGEKQAEFLRMAIEAELKRREKRQAAHSRAI